MNIGIVISSNNPETVWNALRLANTSTAYNNKVSVFLLGEGVEVLSVSTLTFDTIEQYDVFLEQGGKVIGCGVCCDTREDEIPNIKDSLKCEIGSMQQLYDLIEKSDKLLTF